MGKPAYIRLAGSLNLKKVCTHLLTLTVVPRLTLNQKCYQVLKLEIEFLMMNIIYAVLPMCNAHTYRKDDFFIQRRLMKSFKYLQDWGQGKAQSFVNHITTCTLMKHTQHWAYSALQYFHSMLSTMHCKINPVFFLIYGSPGTWKDISML